MRGGLGRQVGASVMSLPIMLVVPPIAAPASQTARNRAFVCLRVVISPRHGRTSMTHRSRSASERALSSSLALQLHHHLVLQVVRLLVSSGHVEAVQRSFARLVHRSIRASSGIRSLLGLG